MATMLAGRGVAGIGAAGLLAVCRVLVDTCQEITNERIQVVRIILTDSSSLDNVNWQQSILFFLFTIGYCLGPFIGGELLTVSFRWIFAIKYVRYIPTVFVSYVHTDQPSMCSCRHGVRFLIPAWYNKGPAGKWKASRNEA